MWTHRSVAFGQSERVVELGAGAVNLVPIAQDIAIHRAQLVTEAMIHMAAVRSLWSSAEERRANIECVKAHSQTSSATHKQQAAHLLPGQIIVNGQPVWERATTSLPALADEVGRLKTQLVHCFAWTNVLPAEFNRADSQAEGRGHEAASAALKPLFGAVVRSLWHNAQVDADLPLVIDRQNLYSALSGWFSQVSRIYRAASLRKAANGRRLEQHVLETYADSFSVVNVGRFVHAHASALYQRYGWR